MLLDLLNEEEQNFQQLNLFWLVHNLKNCCLRIFVQSYDILMRFPWSVKAPIKECQIMKARIPKMKVDCAKLKVKSVYFC